MMTKLQISIKHTFTCDVNKCLTTSNTFILSEQVLQFYKVHMRSIYKVSSILKRKTCEELQLTTEICLSVPKYTVSSEDSSGFRIDQAVRGCFGTLKHILNIVLQ